MRYRFVLSFAVVLLFATAPVLEASLESADKLCHMGRYHEAIEKIEAFLSNEPNHPAAHAILGKAQFHLSRFDQARKSFEKAARIDPGNYVRWTAPFLARLEYWLGNDDAARKHLSNTPSDEFTAKGLPVLLEAEGLKRIDSKHYTIYVDRKLASRGGDKYASRLMELIHDYYLKTFRLKSPAIRSRVYVFSKLSDYLGFVERVTGKPEKGDSASFYSFNYRTLVISADPEGASANAQGFSRKTVSTMFHAGFSQFCHFASPKQPIWLRKGMAEYFSQARVVKGKIKLGVIEKTDPRGASFVSRYQRVKESIKSGALLPLSTFLAQSEKEFKDLRDNRLNTNTAQAWSFVHFLLHAPKIKKKGKKALQTYFVAFRDGATQQDAYIEAFRGFDMKKLEKQWKQYIQKF